MSEQMSAKEAASPSASEPGSLEPLYLHLSVIDPETISALAEVRDGRDRQELALTALKIGLLSLRAARGTVDGAMIRNEGDRLLTTMSERLEGHRDLLDSVLGATLKGYFDPASGLLNERLGRLLRNDGELASLVQAQVTAARGTLNEVFEAHLGESSPIRTLLSLDEGNAFIETVRLQVTDSLQIQEKAILGEFSLDRPDSALRRLVTELQSRHGDLERSISLKVSEVVGEFSLDKEDSALSRLVGRVDAASRQVTSQFSLDDPGSGLNRLMDQLNKHHAEQADHARGFETKVVTLLERLTTRKQESMRSTVHGTEFELRVGDEIRDMCSASGDLFEECGTNTGLVPRSKVGDFLVTLGPDNAAAGASIVIEAKESGSYSFKATLTEADLARRNRGACVCLFVHSTVTAGVDIPELQRWGNDVVVRWSADNKDTDVILRAGLMVAKALCMRAETHADEDHASFDEIDGAVEAIRKLFLGFEEINTTALTVINSGDKIRNRARIMTTQIEKELEVLITNAARLRAKAAPTI